MTVKELIEKLKEMPQDMHVMVACPQAYFADADIYSITQRKLYDVNEFTKEDVIVLND